MGARTRAGAAPFAQILPGSQLPDGTVLHVVGRAVHFAGLATEPDRTWSGNPLCAQSRMHAEPTYAEAV